MINLEKELRLELLERLPTAGRYAVDESEVVGAQNPVPHHLPLFRWQGEYPGPERISQQSPPRHWLSFLVGQSYGG